MFEDKLNEYFDFIRLLSVISNLLLEENNSNNLNLYLWFIKKYLTCFCDNDREYLRVFMKLKENLEDIAMKIVGDSLSRLHEDVIKLIVKCYPSLDEEMDQDVNIDML